MSTRHNIKENSEALRERIAPFAINIAGGFWFASALCLAAARGFGGSLHESVGGAVILTGEATALAFGKLKYAYNFTAAAFIAGTVIQKTPDLLLHPLQSASTFLANPVSPEALLGAEIITLSILNMPAILEFNLKEKAKIKLEQFRAAKHSMLSRTKSEMKKKALWCFANPRRTALNTNAVYLVSNLAREISKHDPRSARYLLPFYGLMLVGNRMATLSERPTVANQTTLAPKVHDLN